MYKLHNFSLFGGIILSRILYIYIDTICIGILRALVINLTNYSYFMGLSCIQLQGQSARARFAHCIAIPSGRFMRFDSHCCKYTPTGAIICRVRIENLRLDRCMYMLLINYWWDARSAQQLLIMDERVAMTIRPLNSLPPPGIEILKKIYIMPISTLSRLMPWICSPYRKESLRADLLIFRGLGR